MKVRAFIIGTVYPYQWNTVNITINNECTTASFTNAALAQVSTTYHVKSAPITPTAAISLAFGPFTISKPACKIVYTLVDS